MSQSDSISAVNNMELSNLNLVSPANARTTVLSYLSQLAPDAVGQAEGLSALSNLLIKYPDETIQNEEDLISTATATITAMQAHLAHSTVQERGCLVLMRLSLSNEAFQLALLRSPPLPVSTDTVIMAAMRAHPLHVGIQQLGAGALWNLAVPKANKAKLTKHEVFSILVDALHNHQENEDVQLQCFGAVSALAGLSDNQVVLASEPFRVQELALQTFARYHDCSELRTCVLSLLSLLASNYANKQLLVSEPCSVQHLALKIINDDASPIKHKYVVVAMIGFLAADESARSILTNDSRLTTSIVELLKKRHNMHISLWGCRTLSILARTESESQRLMQPPHNIHDFIISVMRETKLSAELEAVINLVSALSVNDHNRQVLLGEPYNTKQLVENIQQAWSHQTDLQSTCAQALKALQLPENPTTGEAQE